MLRSKGRPALKLTLPMITALLLGLPLLGSPGYSTDTFFDDLHGSSLNASAWRVELVGGDVGVASPQADGLHLRLSELGNTTDFGVVVWFVPVVSGDFDASVDFRLLTWPTMNGNGISISSMSIGGILRYSYRSFEAHPGEHYLTHCLPVGQGDAGLTPTTDTQGRLRLTRVGNTYAGYRWDGVS
mgnify:CR=1 FL=1